MWVFRGADLYHVSTFLSLASQIFYLLFEIIDVLAEDVHPHFIDFTLVKTVNDVHLLVGLLSGGSIGLFFDLLRDRKGLWFGRGR